MEAHLQSIDEKLETVVGQSIAESGSNALQLRRIEEERMSTQKCLQICAQLLEHINQIQLTPEISNSSADPMGPGTLPERLTVTGLQECKNNLALTVAKLDGHMKELIDRLVTESKATTTSKEHLADLTRLREEWDTTRQCQEICSKAETYLKENVSTIENYSTGDAVQFMVSTDGTVLRGTNRGLGWRTRQLGGHVSDATVQQISRDFTTINIQNAGSESTSSRENTQPVQDGSETKHKSGSKFNERYGPGVKLTPGNTADAAMSSAGAAQGSLGGSAKK
jgi:hypothetical protein